MYADADEIVKIFCDEILSVDTQKSSKIDKITYFGEGYSPHSTLINSLQLSENSKFHIKMVKDSCLFESCSKKKKTIKQFICSFER